MTIDNVYRTEDGEVFDTLAEAEYHQSRIDAEESIDCLASDIVDDVMRFSDDPDVSLPQILHDIIVQHMMENDVVIGGEAKPSKKITPVAYLTSIPMGKHSIIPMCKDSICTTRCDYKTSKVGSVACQDCEYYEGRDTDKQIVFCSHPER